MKEGLNKEGCDILLIHPSYHRRRGSGIIPPIGLAYIILSLRKAGFKAQVLDCALHFGSLDTLTIKQMKNWLRKELILANPRLAIGIGPCTTSAIRSIIAITDVCNEIYAEIPLIFGGPLTLIPHQEWLFFERLNAFAIVKGDGEYALSSILIQLCKQKSLSDIPGVQSSKNQLVKPYFIEDIDDLYPAWDEFNMAAYKPSTRRDLFIYPFASMVGSRGCPHHCSFCISGQLIKYRRHSFEYIAEQVGILRKNYNIRSIIFYDDSLFPYPLKINDEINLFADLLSQSASDILWQIEIRPDVFCQISKETFKHIFYCGCRQMNIGIEKFSSSQLKLIFKSFDIDQLRKKCQLVSKVCPKMRLTGTFILGGPGENLGLIHKTIQFSTELKCFFAHYYPLELYPGTSLYHFVFGQENDSWFNKIMNDKYPWGEIIYESNDIPATQLMDLIHSAYRYFYNRNEWKKIAKIHLGRNYEKIRVVVKSWQEDRFQLSQCNKI